MNNPKNYSSGKIINFPDRRQRQLWKKAKLQTIWQYLSVLFTKKPELQIQQQCDRLGNIWWNAYDPVTGMSKRFISQAEMLKWLEAYYSR